ncbi:hypothetical protein Micbo1qcDRAFT_168942, partial [Microdochium bolleyi]
MRPAWLPTPRLAILTPTAPNRYVAPHRRTTLELAQTRRPVPWLPDQYPHPNRSTPGPVPVPARWARKETLAARTSPFISCDPLPSMIPPAPVLYLSNANYFFGLSAGAQFLDFADKE